jgi:hypothetical protein
MTMKAVLPLALALAAGTVFACPGANSAKDAKADLSPSVTAALSDKAAPATKADVGKKAVKPAEAKKPST